MLRAIFLRPLSKRILTDQFGIEIPRLFAEEVPHTAAA
jgi:hypothetical protein